MNGVPCKWGITAWRDSGKGGLGQTRGLRATSKVTVLKAK